MMAGGNHMEQLLARGIWWAVVCGLGLGLIAAGVIVSFIPDQSELTNAQVIERARALGMQELSVLPPVSIWVTPGMTYVEVGQMLYDSGLITDPSMLRLRAEERGLGAGLKDGAHLIRVGDSVDQILTKISRTE
jgi:cell division protein YceG involved in septum cleavage